MRTPFFRSMLLALIFALALPGAASAGASARHLNLTAPDGTRIAATYWSPGAPGPGVVLLHMCNSSREAWYGLGPRLAARGIHAIALDYRGYGASGGVRRLDEPREQQRIIDELWPGDVDAAFAYLTAQPGVDRQRIGAAGGSCGVNQAVQLARRHPEVRTLALLAGSPNRIGETFLAETPWMPLFAAAADDDGGAVEMMEWVLGFSAYPKNKMLRYADGGHGTQIFTVHLDLEPALVDWFAEHLIAHPAVPTAAGAPAPAPGPSARAVAAVRAPGGAAKLRGELAAAKAKGGTPPALPPEGVVNLLGYEFLQNGDPAGAIEVFLLNAEAHPTSANTYDSLGDAYLAAGKPDLVREAVAKTLAALDGDPAIGEPFKQTLRDAAQAKLDQLAGGG